MQKSRFYFMVSFQKRLMKQKQKKLFVYFRNGLTEAVTSSESAKTELFSCFYFFGNVARI